jgi:hypothetical protein
MKIDKPTWAWSYDQSLGWKFEVGQPHLRTMKLVGKTRSRIHGDHSLHVIAAKWTIKKQGAVVVSSRSPEARIKMHFARLNGIRLRSINLDKAGWVRRATFDENYVLELSPLSWASPEGTANWVKYT